MDSVLPADPEAPSSAVDSTIVGCGLGRSVPVDGDGLVDPAALAAALQADGEGTVLVSVTAANNETGALQPIVDLAALAHQRGALLHCDAAQAVGKIDVDVEALGVDLLTVVGHKMYAPKGIAALNTQAMIDAVAERAASSDPLALLGAVRGSDHVSFNHMIEPRRFLAPVLDGPLEFRPHRAAFLVAPGTHVRA